MGMGALSPEHVDGSEGTISWRWEHGDGSMGMRVWDESVWMITWEWEFFLVFCFQTILNFLSNDFISHIDMDAWRWEMWGREFIPDSVFRLLHISFVDHMISFLKYGEERI